MTISPELETVSAEIHKLYCIQYEKDHSTPYWTEGDYSKLEERVKEYDRNIARFVLEREALIIQKVIEEIKYLHKGPDSQLNATSFANGYRLALKHTEETLSELLTHQDTQENNNEK